MAKRVVAHETDTNGPAETGRAEVLFASENLRSRLATLVGTVGVHALVSRALALGCPEVPWLRAVHIKTDGSIDGLVEARAKVGPKKFADGNVAVLAQLLGLLATFIGEDLTVGLVREVWPKVPLGGLDFGEGKGNERPKRRG